MGLEQNSIQDHSLNACDASPIDEEGFHDLLLSTLRSMNFHSFKDAIEYGNQSTALNVNYIYLNASKETCLDIASRTGLTEFVKFLLHKGAEPNRINNVYNRAPIHFATEGGHVRTLAALLKAPTINMNLEAGHQTALHIAMRRNDLICASLLLENGASASIPNSKGLTALHLAAMKDQRDMVELILEKSRQCPDIDTYKDYNDQTTREVIQQKLPDITLPPESENREVNVHDLKYYLNANDETKFLKSMELVETESFHCEAEELLEIAVQHKFYNAVIEILEKFKGSLNIRKAAEAAVLQSHSDILRKLLRVEPKVANDLILSVCQQLEIPERRKDNNTSDRLECLKLILEQKDVDIHRTDSKGNTPLHYAIRAGCAEAVTLLLNRNSYIGYMNNFNVPPIANIPSRILSRYFDDCLRKNRTNEHMIEFDYHCLMPHDVLKKHDETCQVTREMEVFQYIAGNSGLKHLLMHPLLSSFLYLKWYNIRHVFYMKFIFYAIFYVLLNAYILYWSSSNVTNENRKQIVNDSSNITLENLLQIGSYQIIFLRICIILLLLLFMFWEIIKFISRPWNYLTNFENLLHNMLIGLTVVFICGVNQMIGIILILLSTRKLMILISQHKDMFTSFEMFRMVSITYVRLLFPYMFFITAFVLTFCTLFENKANFSDPMHLFVEITTMLTGKFNDNDILFTVTHRIWKHIAFVLFLFSIASLIVHLFNGLVLIDTAEILIKAKLMGLISSIRVISDIENMAMSKLFRHYLCCENSRWNPFGFLAKKIFLFPHYLRNGKVKLYDSINYDKYNKLEVMKDVRNVNHDKYCTILRMDPNIMKQAEQILNKNQLSDNDNKMMELIKLQEQFATMKVAYNKILQLKYKVENSNIKSTMESVRKK